MLNFMLIGATKSGTSSIYEYLKQHPSVFLPTTKEPKYFQWENESHRYSTQLDSNIFKNSVTTFDEYQKLFLGSDSFKAVGEASVSYLYNRNTAERIHKRYSNTKLIAVLRRPDQRAFSHFVHTKWLGHEPLSFSEAIKSEEQRINNNWGPSWHYIQQGFYSEQIQRYYNYFGREQVKIVLYDDLIKDPIKLMAELFEHIEVDNFLPDMGKKHNVKSFAKFPMIEKMIVNDSIIKSLVKRILPQSLKGSIKKMNHEKLVFPEEMHEQLIDIFSGEITKLEKLIDRDLSSWRKPFVKGKN